MEDQQVQREKLWKLEKAKYNALKYISIFIFSMTMLFYEPRSIYTIYQGGGIGAICLIYALTILMVIVEQILVLAVGASVLLEIEDSLNKEGSQIKLWFLHFLRKNKEMNYLWVTLLLYSLRNIITFPCAVNHFSTDLADERGRMNFKTIWFLVFSNFPVFCIYVTYFCYGLFRFIGVVASLGMKNLLIVVKNHDIDSGIKDE